LDYDDGAMGVAVSYAVWSLWLRGGCFEIDSDRVLEAISRRWCAMRLRCAVIGLGVVIPVWKVRHVSMAQYLPVAKLIAATPPNVASWMARLLNSASEAVLMAVRYNPATSGMFEVSVNTSGNDVLSQQLTNLLNEQVE
jgi:hypothetical protein